MNNKPVAWMYKNDSDTFFSAIDHSVNNKWIPLYTHPVKELTDEEILDFINAFCLDMGDYWELTERNAIPMIRAILRKASEK